MPSALVSPHIVVVGGGISGLAAAWALCRPEMAREPDARALLPRVTVLESSARFGGKIQTSEFADVPVDTGPDAFLARSPWALQLCKELGITTELTPPAAQHAWLWSRGQLRRFPEHTILGSPSSLVSLSRSGAITPAGIVRAAAEPFLPRRIGRSGEDPSVAQLIGCRLGHEVLERLVDPLIGGINGGSTQDLSLTSVAPQLADIASRRRSMLVGTREQLRRRNPESANKPVFQATKNGMSHLVDVLVERLTEAGVTLRTEAGVNALAHSATDKGRWQLDIGQRDTILADAVLIATPAPEAALLLKEVCAEAVPALNSITYSSVAMVRLAYTTASVGCRLEGSGFVVPAVDGRLVTACSWASSKWEHLQRPGQVVLRASAGRLHDGRAQAMSDEELIAAVHGELTTAMGAKRRPFAADVTRWDHSFPQYEPGHAARILRIEQAVGAQPGLAVAGAAYHGLGIPSCINSGNEAAESLLAQLSIA